MAAKDDEEKLPSAQGAAPASAPAPKVKVEGPEKLDDKKQDLKQEQKKQQQQGPTDTAKNLTTTSSWMEFFVELMKYLKENSTKKSQQPQAEQKTTPELSKDKWNKVEASSAAKDAKASTVTMGSHRTKAKESQGATQGNEAFLKENLKDSGLTSGQVKGLAGMFNAQGVNLQAVKNQNSSQANKRTPAENKANRDFVQQASDNLGIGLDKKVIDKVAGLANDIGVNFNSIMNKAASKTAGASKGAAPAAKGPSAAPNAAGIQAMKKADIGSRPQSVSMPKAATSAASSSTGDKKRPSSVSYGGGGGGKKV